MTTFSPLNSNLMIQVRALHGVVPVEMFLRAARELAAVAAEVGQTHNAQVAADGRSQNDTPELSLPNTHDPEDSVTDGVGESTTGWRIVRAESTPSNAQPLSKTEGMVDLGDTSGQMVALVIAPPLAQRGAVQVVREGVRSIQAGDPQRPVGFSDAALRGLRRAASLSGRQFRITLSSGQGEGQAVPLDAAIVAQIDSWLEGQRNAIGSVEGQLDVISVHNRLRFTLYGGHGERIDCLFDQELLPEVKSALGERVCIRGRVHYRKDGVPASVEVQRMRLMRPQSQLVEMQTLNMVQGLW